jgi:hypothetical protein
MIDSGKIVSDEDSRHVISSDDRSEKSLKTGFANGDFRDFSSLRSSK